MATLLWALSEITNSAFKTIDILPGQVMRWVGAQVDSRMDDASNVQTMAMGTVNQFGMMSSMRSAATEPQVGAGGEPDQTPDKKPASFFGPGNVKVNPSTLTEKANPNGPPGF